MEILFLGTSSGTPTKQRNVSGLAIRKANSKAWCLVDCGEGTQHQLLETNLTLKNLQAIFITHIHGDHCYGLPGLLASAAMQGRDKALWLVGPKKIQQYIEAVMKTTDLWLGFDIKFVDVEGLSDAFQVAEFEVDAVRLSHRVPSYAYSFTEETTPGKLNQEKLKSDGIPAGPTWGKIQCGEDVVLDDGRKVIAEDYLLPPETPRRIIVSGDNDAPELLSRVAGQASVLVHESTYTQEHLDKVGSGPQHSSAKIVAEFAETCHLPNLVLTHFSPRYVVNGDPGHSINDIEEEARSIYSGNLFLANDLECYELKKDGLLVRTK
ncbi:ribonuclease Z [Hahella sp. CCB-MM4]|uniref:ribonuclease Z n=1 Tax=Hahella sp. (strain CCB-MM4) TaxID=1926491 RepID=UPI000B9C13F7|nr:ribonuclease Z [Hahella sp. CCB-MM4]OZG70267.1 ribonuclease Z [Hahella sp. CCB-MM4]